MAAKERSKTNEKVDEEDTVIYPFDPQYSVANIEIAPIVFKRNKCWSDVYERDDSAPPPSTQPRQKLGISIRL